METEDPGDDAGRPVVAPVPGTALRVHKALAIPMSEITWRATTSGGPGGQHANRTLSRVEVQFEIAGSAVLGPRQRARLLERYGPVVRAAASESRSQARNRQLALERLATRLAEGLQGRSDAATDAAHQGFAGPPGRGQAPPIGGEAPPPGARRRRRVSPSRATARRVQLGQPERPQRRRQTLVEQAEELRIRVRPRSLQRGEGGVAPGHQGGVLVGIGQPDLARAAGTVTRRSARSRRAEPGRPP